MARGAEVVCVCGSLRFAAEIDATAWELTLQGCIVLVPVLPPASGLAPSSVDPALRTRLGQLHLRRIDLADRVVVVDPGGYVGLAVEREIAYARTIGTPVSFTHTG